MSRGPLYEDGYRPQLSGHETFPLRYGWLKKAFDAVRDTEGRRRQSVGFLGRRRHRTVWRRQEHGRVHAPLGDGGRCCRGVGRAEIVS